MGIGRVRAQLARADRHNRAGGPESRGNLETDMLRLGGLVLVWLVAISAACRSPDESARDQFRVRLRNAAPLSRDDMRRLMDEIARAMSGKVARVQEGPITRELDDRGRSAIFELLTGRIGVDDAGPRIVGRTTLRGLRGPATPSTSEIDATQTLWVDTDTLLPRRYELTYSMPGFGDVGYDLTFGER
jgi:hypothetical protein